MKQYIHLNLMALCKQWKNEQKWGKNLNFSVNLLCKQI